MAEFRHGFSDNMTGWLYTRNRFGVRKKKKFFILSSQSLGCAEDDVASPTTEIQINGAKIMPHNDSLCIKIKNEGKVWMVQSSTDDEYNDWLQALQKASGASIENYYELGEKLGEGAFATVVLGIDKVSLENFAIKVIDKGKAENELEFIQREMRIMRSLNHPNVVRTYDMFQTKSSLYLVMEYMPGGTLADIMKAKVLRTEKAVKSVMREILMGVAYLHSKQIVHRDLKLKNILCRRKEMPLEIKLADFGLSNNVGVRTISRAALKSQVGSPHFVAPEVLRDQPYGTAVDLWSCGVILHLLLTAKYPFNGKTVQETLKMVCAAKFDMSGSAWSLVSKEGQDFVERLLSESPEKRPTAEEALNDRWFSAISVKRKYVRPEITN